MRVSFSPSWQRSLTFLHEHARLFALNSSTEKRHDFPILRGIDTKLATTSGRGERRERERDTSRESYIRSISNERSRIREKRFVLPFSIAREFSREKQVWTNDPSLFLIEVCKMIVTFFFFLRNYRRENQWYFRVLYLFRENGNVRGKSVIQHWSVNRSFIDCDVVRRVGGR